MPRIETYADGRLVSVEDGRSVGDAATEAAERIESGYAAAIAAGIAVGGIVLGAGDSDRAAFVQLLTLLREAEALAGDLGDSMTTIADAGGAAHEMPVRQVRMLLCQYGQAIQGLWMRKSSLTAAALAAGTIEAADAVRWMA